MQARDLARVAYDAAKSASRMARAKEAHDDVIRAVYRMQADALKIETRAKIRLADEYDAAQERGELAKPGNSSNREELGSAENIGVSHKEIHEARQFRNAERDNPSIVDEVIEGFVEPEPSMRISEGYLIFNTVS